MTTMAETATLRVNANRLVRRLQELGQIGGLEGGGCSRLALTDADREGRDLVTMWMRDAGLDVAIDGIGNVVGTRPGREDGPPVMCGSHVDTVATGGIYDGNLGVLGGLEVMETLNDAGLITRRPLALAFFTDEEGSRFAPDMLGSLVYAGGLAVEAAHDIVAIDGPASATSSNGSATSAPRRARDWSRMPTSSFTSSKARCWTPPMR